MNDAAETSEAGRNTPRDLKPANENPWYILMTLYGEQEAHLSYSERKELQEKNIQAWNSWVQFGLTETSELKLLFETEAKRRSSKKLRPPMPHEEISFVNLSIENLFLDGAHIPQKFTLVRCDVGEFSAREAVFKDECVFEDNRFSAETVFFQSQFGSLFYSTDNHFEFGANFRYATFDGELSSHYDRFDGEVSFCYNRFGGRSRFEGTVFGSREFFGDFEGLFCDCVFEGPTSFHKTKFVGLYPKFDTAHFHDTTIFSSEEEFWPSSTNQPPEEAKRACAAVRHALAKQGLPEDEHFFFRREMQFARQIGSFWQQLPYHLFGIFSEYGYSIQRPLWWLLSLWAFGFAAFWGYLSSCCVPKPLKDVETPMGAAFGLSLSNLFPVFGFGRSFGLNDILAAMPPALQAYAGFQTMAALPLIFFLGLALRQRFRLR